MACKQTKFSLALWILRSCYALNGPLKKSLCEALSPQSCSNVSICVPLRSKVLWEFFKSMKVYSAKEWWDPGLFSKSNT